MTTIAAIVVGRSVHMAADTCYSSEGEVTEQRSKFHDVPGGLLAVGGSFRATKALTRLMREPRAYSSSDVGPNVQWIAEEWWRRCTDLGLTVDGNIRAGALLALPTHPEGPLWRLWDRDAEAVTEWAEGTGGREARAALLAFRGHLSPPLRPLAAVRAGHALDLYTRPPFDAASVGVTGAHEIERVSA